MVVEGVNNEHCHLVQSPTHIFTLFLLLQTANKFLYGRMAQSVKSDTRVTLRYSIAAQWVEGVGLVDLYHSINQGYHLFNILFSEMSASISFQDQV